MKSIRVLLTLLALVGVSASTCWANEDMPAMPKPSAQHAWLQQFVGEWESKTQAYMEPGKPPVEMSGTETVRPLGEFWTISEIKSTMADTPFTGNMTLGYDAEAQKYVGTWVDSMTGHMWKYEGAVDPSGKILTLETEGACPMRPGKLTRFKEVIELKSNDLKTFTSSMMGDDGQWVTMMISEATRK